MSIKRNAAAIFATLLLLIFLLTGCSVSVKPSENKPSASDYLQQIDLSIVGVGLGLSASDADLALIRQFEKESGARVIIKQTAAGTAESDYLSYLSLLVNSNGLPDIVIFPSFADTYKKQYLYGLNEFLKEDTAFAALPAVLRNTVTDRASIYALPLRYCLEGYFLRTADCTAQKLTAPAFGISFNRFFNTAKALAEAGLLTCQPLYAIPYWYPAAQEDLGWCGYRDESFRFADQSFLTGISYAKQLDSARSDQPVTVSALRYDSTANLTALQADGYDTYLGIPGGRAVINADYIGITRQSAHKKEAFALAKWLSYDPVGVALRLKEYPQDSFPATRSAKTATCYSLPGIAAAFDNIDQAIVHGTDCIPDYTEIQQKKFLLSYQKETAFCLEDVLHAAISGALPFATYAAELEEVFSK